MQALLRTILSILLLNAAHPTALRASSFGAPSYSLRVRIYVSGLQEYTGIIRVDFAQSRKEQTTNDGKSTPQDTSFSKIIKFCDDESNVPDSLACCPSAASSFQVHP